MQTTDWLIACIPILSFGLIPVIATFTGGKAVEQSLGISIGSLVFALVLYFIQKPEYTASVFGICLLSGLSWAIGSVGQFKGLQYLGVAKSMPISDGGQIIGTSLLGVALGEWATTNARIYGFSALALIITGIVFTSFKQHSDPQKTAWGKGILINLLSVVGFTGYVGILKYYHINGWTSLLPQALGQILGILLLSFLVFKVQPFSRLALKNSIGGIIWAIGNIALLLSQARIGLAVAYPVSQAAVIISVLGGVFVNKERKNNKEWIFTLIGMAFIVAGLYLIYLSASPEQ